MDTNISFPQHKNDIETPVSDTVAFVLKLAELDRLGYIDVRVNVTVDVVPARKAKQERRAWDKIKVYLKRHGVSHIAGQSNWFGSLVLAHDKHSALVMPKGRGRGQQ